jgi:predicted amidohydrolase
MTYLARYQDLARELNINIVAGTICEVHPPPAESALDTAVPSSGEDGAQPAAEIRNMAYFVAAGSGEVIGAYQKKNLWHPERAHLTGSAGAPHVAFDVPTLPALEGTRVPRAGMLVCWDLAFPEAFRALVADGADIIVVPSFWYMDDVDPVAQAINPDCERVFINSTLAARACENSCAVVYVNTGGLSQVAMPLLGAVGVMEPEEEGLKVVEIDMGILKVAESNYKTREDMRKQGWHYAYTLPTAASSS